MFNWAGYEREISGFGITGRRAALLVVLGSWFAWSRPHDRHGLGPAPLNQSKFLADVVEPITIVSGMSFDDGGSQGLRFKDAHGVMRDLCLESMLSHDEDNRPEERLSLNSFHPGRRGMRAWRGTHSWNRGARFTPPGMLERWATRQEPCDAQELERAVSTL